MPLTELEAFELIRKKLGNKAFEKPKGSDAGFPDFGIIFESSKGPINVYIEHKQDYSAQMSGLSSWYYKNNTFNSNVLTDEARSIVRQMQRSRELKEAASELLLDKKRLLGKTRSVYLDSSRVTNEFAESLEGRKVLGNIKTPTISSLVSDIYKAKFRSNIKNSARYHICLMMFDDEVWLLDTYGNPDLKELEKALGGKIPKFSLRNCYLQVRVSPRSNGRLDTRALIKLSGKQSIVRNGLKIKNN